MYINKIDDVISNIIDDFFLSVIDTKDVLKLFEEKNFVQHQGVINKISMNYMKNMNTSKISDIIKDEYNFTKIIEIIKRYLGYYIFLSFAFYYKDSSDLFVNNVIEYSKNQTKFNYKIVNFFNSDSNATIINFYQRIKIVKELMTIDKVKLSQLVRIPKYHEEIEFLNELGNGYVESNFKLENLDGKVKNQCHNIVKTFIIREIYLKKDKDVVYEFINNVEIESGEYIYIDVVIPKKEIIDYDMIETSLAESTGNRNLLASDIYDLLMSTKYISKKEMSVDKKFDRLIKNKLVIPVTEDFLLYHKDIEKYEGQTADDKKKDTRLKYIVGKIDSVTNYHSVDDKSKIRIEKKFYQPMSDRNIVLINHMEDSVIVYKIMNQGGITNEMISHYNDFMSFKKYPYINFKKFKTYGFEYLPDKTYDAIRSTNFSKLMSQNPSYNVDFRIINSDGIANVTGIILPSLNTHFKCLKNKEIIDIRKVGVKDKKNIKVSQNGYNGTLRILKKKIIDKKSTVPPIRWMFNLDTDNINIDKYENIHGNKNEHVKLMISKLYDDVMALYNIKLSNYIEKKGKIRIDYFFKLLDRYDRKIGLYKNNQNMLGNLKRIVLSNNIINVEDEYDTNEDIFHGLGSDRIALPKKDDKKKHKVYTIRLKGKDDNAKKDDNYEEKLDIAICQHYITWDTISKLKKGDLKQSERLLYDFLQKYVIKDHSGDYICKSCSELIDVKNFVVGGSYENGQFITFTSELYIPLEDVSGYEKYKSAIKNMEKITDRIGSICNINTISGHTKSIRISIRKIVKDTIDLVLLHNAKLKSKYKDRREKISMYGLNKNSTNLWIFDLDNSIFVYSSKDKDFHKVIKKNNILIYQLFIIMLEINDHQYYNLSKNKLCNFTLFEKYGMVWFKNIYILVNNKNKMEPITKYKLLCYLIFYMSCMVMTYNLWSTENTDAPKKKFDPNVQIVIIMTFIDFLNSIIEIYNKDGKRHYTYEIIVNRYFEKLHTVYNNDEIIDKVNDLDKIKISHNKRILKDVQAFLLESEYNKPYDKYVDDKEFVYCKGAISRIAKKTTIFQKENAISDVTNCPGGTFHKWFNKNGQLTCSICGQTPNIDKKIKDDKIKYNNIQLGYLKLYQRYCKSGQQHMFENNKCVKCGVKKESKSSNEDIKKLITKLDKSQETMKVNLESIPKKTNTIEKDVVNNLKSLYGKSKDHREDYFKFIDKFIYEIEKEIGIDVNINGQNIYLKYDVYIVDHDHNGYKIPKPIIILNKVRQVNIYKNHPFFKTDVIYFTNNKLNIQVFYNLYTKLLIGFKEKGKEFSFSKNKNMYLIINYSILNQLKQIGHKHIYTDVKDTVEYYKDIYKKDEPVAQIVLSNIIRERIYSLKNCLKNIQIYFYSVINHNIPDPVSDSDSDLLFLNKYKNKIDNIITRGKDGKFFEHWVTIKESIFMEKNKKITLPLLGKDYLYYKDVSDYDYHGNLLIFYIVSEIKKLLDMNTNKFIRTNICYLFIDSIITLYQSINKDKHLINNELKKFIYIISKETDITTSEYVDITVATIDVEEKTEEDEKRLDYDKEADDALDIGDTEMEFDNIDYFSQ